MVKIISWNVNGIRSKSMDLITKEKSRNLECNFSNMINKYDPDIICLGETKCQQKHETELNKYIPFEYKIWNSSKEKLGYSGVSVFSKFPFKDMGTIPGLEDDNFGRNLYLEFEKFILINVYVPNSGGDKDNYRKDWDLKIKKFLISIDKIKPVIYCGDLNVVYENNDIYNPNILNHGTSPGTKLYERQNFKELLDIGFCDATRFMVGKDSKLWTWWDPRSRARLKDNGWRLDYFLVSNPNIIKSSKILNEIYGSDHCPIYLELNN